MTTSAGGAGELVGVLRRALEPSPRPRPGEVCEMCGEPIAAEHRHVADVTNRRLLCTCHACHLLFTQEGAGARRLRAVPLDSRAVPDFAFSQAQWDELAIPVGLVFLFRQSDPADPQAASKIVACYPSPAGATESELDLGAWAGIAAGNPVLAEVEPDVQAVLVRRHDDGTFSCFVTPIDTCYALVGLVREHWTGFAGGAEVWRRIDAFFAALAERATPIRTA